jgi:GNAT superfamily N-acetyltransferase
MALNAPNLPVSSHRHGAASRLRSLTGSACHGRGPALTGQALEKALRPDLTSASLGAMIDQPGVEVRRTVAGDWQLWRSLRLAALADAPTAFGFTLAQAQAMPEEFWRDWWAEHGSTALRAIALVGGAPAGMIACQVYRGPDADPDLTAMWVDPRSRGSGVADALVTAAKDWARDSGHARIRLGVTVGNETARKLYLRHGFVATGRFEPLMSNSDLQVEWMLGEV